MGKTRRRRAHKAGPDADGFHFELRQVLGIVDATSLQRFKSFLCDKLKVDLDHMSSWEDFNLTHIDRFVLFVQHADLEAHGREVLAIRRLIEYRASTYMTRDLFIEHSEMSQCDPMYLEATMQSYTTRCIRNSHTKSSLSLSQRSRQAKGQMSNIEKASRSRRQREIHFCLQSGSDDFAQDLLQNVAREYWLLGAVSTSIDDPEQYLTIKANIEELQAIFDELPIKFQLLFRLMLKLDSQTIIAKQMGLSSSTITRDIKTLLKIVNEIKLKFTLQRDA